MALHLGLVVGSTGSAFFLRFDGAPPPWAMAAAWQTLPWLLLTRGVSFVVFRLYEGLWRYTSIWDLQKLVLATVSSTVAFWLINSTLVGSQYPRSVYVIEAGIFLGVTSGARILRRIVAERGSGRGGKRVLVYGAGDAGEAIVRDMQRDGARAYRPIGFIDDDRGKVRKRIHGIRVLGTGSDLPAIMASAKPDEVLVAMPNAAPATLRGIVRSLDRFSVPIKTLPSLHDLLERGVEIGQIRNLLVSDLLSRGTVDLNRGPVRTFLTGRDVLVTGAGGSIGSELCRQIASLNVASLVLFDHSENGLAQLTHELSDRGVKCQVCTVVGDITDRARVGKVFAAYRPQAVFHAAAHKHVPLMEHNATEAVKNNVTGTRVLAEAAERCGVERFVQVSSDKAVNPTSVMGATKRVAELLLQTQGRGSGTRFMTVRFGNVLGSNGSVIPRFQDQIKKGGPVTVTHPEVRRFFMLITEAVQLVLHAAAHGEANRLYVLEMGEQVKLVDMARDLIRLSGFVPEEEIAITFIGMRPGEKLYEELIGADERAVSSRAAKVMEIEPLRLPDTGWLKAQVFRLEQLAEVGDDAAVVDQLGAIVPECRLGRSDPQKETRAEVTRPLKVLFVCATNIARSRVAETVFLEMVGHRGCEARSAGIALSAARRLTTRDIAWADLVAVMQDEQLAVIQRDWPHHAAKVRVLGVADAYSRGEAELREVLSRSIRNVLTELR